VGEAQAAEPIALASRPPQGQEARTSCIVGKKRWWWATRELTATHAVTGVSVWVIWPRPGRFRSSKVRPVRVARGRALGRRSAREVREDLRGDPPILLGHL
jgi:hypothetical protein